MLCLVVKKVQEKKSWEIYNNFFKKLRIYIYKLIENTIFLLFYKLNFFIFKYLFIILLVMLTSNVTCVFCVSRKPFSYYMKDNFQNLKLKTV